MPQHITSASSLDWITPSPIIERVRAAFGGTIDLDPCSNQWSRVQARVEYRLPESDGLKDSWNYSNIFVNPPYGRCHVHQVTREYMSAGQYKLLDKQERRNWNSTTLADWIRRCADANRHHGSRVITLIPAALDTKHWHEVIFKTAAAACFSKGRIKFELPPDQKTSKNAPPMGTALVYWGDDADRFTTAFNDLGHVIRLAGVRILKAA